MTLERFMQRLPTVCLRDADCDGYYFRADPCAPAVVLAKPGVDAARERQLLDLQKRVRNACAAEWSQQPACSPIPFRARCLERRCVDAAAEPARAQGGLGAARPSTYPHAYIRRQCAPWDGPAFGLYLTPSKTNCQQVHEPYLAIGLWRDLPKSGPKTIEIDSRQFAGHASHCPKPRACEAALSATVVFERFEEGRQAAGRFELRFKDGRRESGSFQAEWCPDAGPCG